MKYINNITAALITVLMSQQAENKYCVLKCIKTLITCATCSWRFEEVREQGFLVFSSQGNDKSYPKNVD